VRKPGPLRSIPFDQLKVGTWTTDNLNAIPDDAPELQSVMKDLRDELKAQPTFIVVNNQQVPYTNMKAELQIEDMQGPPGQPSLKHLVLGIHWNEQTIDPVKQQPGYFVDAFVHRDSNYIAGGE